MEFFTGRGTNLFVKSFAKSSVGIFGVIGFVLRKNRVVFLWMYRIVDGLEWKGFLS